MTLDPRSPSFAREARRALVILTGINLVNYLDRYVVSALVETLKHPLHPLPDAQGNVASPGLGFTDFEAGALVPAFMVVYALTSGIFGSLGDRVPRPRLVALGVGIWSLATALGGLAGSFLGLFLARALVGVGEAAYGTISPALLADYHPPVNRGRVFAIFFAAIPVGGALGFILGGAVDQWAGWRAAFYIAGVPGLALALFALTLRDPPRGGLDAPAPAPGSGGAPGSPPVPIAHVAPHGKRAWSDAYAPLLPNRRYRLTVLGYAFATFAAGGLGFWMPAFLERVRHTSKSDATVQLGIITAISALVGTFLGGVLAERVVRRGKHGHLWFCGVSTLLAVPFVLLALALPTPALYLPAIVLGLVFLFASTGPVNLAIVYAVRPDQRVAAVALSIFTIHVLGDVPSPPLIGFISDRADSLGLAVMLVPVAVLAAGVVWTYAAWRCERDAKPPEPPPIAEVFR